MTEDYEITLHSADVYDLESWDPNCLEPWEVNFTVIVHGESFQMQMKSVGMINACINVEQACIPGRAIIVSKYTYDGVVQAVKRVFALCYDKDWDKMRRNLNWYMQSEYEVVSPDLSLPGR